jgi:hypothetical protein
LSDDTTEHVPLTIVSQEQATPLIGRSCPILIQMETILTFRMSLPENWDISVTSFGIVSGISSHSAHTRSMDSRHASCTVTVVA